MTLINDFDGMGHRVFEAPTNDSVLVTARFLNIFVCEKKAN